MNFSRIGTCVLFFGLLWQAMAEGSARKALDTGYARYAVGMVKKDVKGLLSLWTEDGTFKEADGSVAKRSELPKILKGLFATTTFTQVIPKITRVIQKDKQAVAYVTIVFSGPMKDARGKKHTFELVSNSRDTWIKTSAGWRIKEIRRLSSSTMQDGKPFVSPPATKS